MADATTFEQEVARLIVEALNLEDVKPESIEPEAALFREGLGLDSIDALELALAISKKYGFKLQSDDKQNSEGRDQRLGWRQAGMADGWHGPKGSCCGKMGGVSRAQWATA